MKSASEIAISLLEDSTIHSRMKETRERMEHHNRRITHHENEQEKAGDNYSKIAHHQIAADHHQKAHDAFSRAYNHYALKQHQSGDAAFARGERHAQAAKHHVTAGVNESVDEALLAKAAGIAARLAVSDKRTGLHQFADVAQAGAEYAVHRGEEMLKHGAGQIAKGARDVAKRLTSKKEPVTEDRINELTGKGKLEDIRRTYRDQASQNMHDRDEAVDRGDEDEAERHYDDYHDNKWNQERAEDLANRHARGVVRKTARFRKVTEENLEEVSKDKLVRYMTKAAGNIKRDKGKELAANKYWNSPKVRVGSEGKNHTQE